MSAGGAGRCFRGALGPGLVGAGVRGFVTDILVPVIGTMTELKGCRR